MHTKESIVDTLESGHKSIIDYVSGLSKETFFNGSDERWSPAHHVGHLTLTHTSVSRGFPLKDRLPVYDKPSRSYDEIKTFYLEALKNAPPAFLANNPFAVKIKPEDTQQGLLETFKQKVKDLYEPLESWSEEELDTKAMKHPVLGLLSVREMFFFIAIHDQHHLEGIQNLVSQKV
jgi:hypothetical protein